jgi:hypothetical protein
VILFSSAFVIRICWLRLLWLSKAYIYISPEKWKVYIGDNKVVPEAVNLHFS